MPRVVGWLGTKMYTFLNRVKSPRALISQIHWEQVEHSCHMNYKGSSPGLFHFCCSIRGNAGWNGQPPPSVTPLQFEGLALNEPLALFSPETDLGENPKVG